MALSLGRCRCGASSGITHSVIGRSLRGPCPSFRAMEIAMRTRWPSFAPRFLDEFSGRDEVIPALLGRGWRNSSGPKSENPGFPELGVGRGLAVEFRPRDGSDFAVYGDARTRLTRLDRSFGVRTKVAVDGPWIKGGSHVLENALQKPDVGALGALF